MDYGEDVKSKKQLTFREDVAVNLRKVIVVYEITLPPKASRRICSLGFTLGLLISQHTFFTVRMEAVYPFLVFVEI